MLAYFSLLWGPVLASGKSAKGGQDLMFYYRIECLLGLGGPLLEGLWFLHGDGIWEWWGDNRL